LTDRTRPGRHLREDQEGEFRHIVGEWLTKTKGLWLCDIGADCRSGFLTLARGLYACLRTIHEVAQALRPL
jgi:hypothetical protein